ncbi:MAG: efflux RND transporter periplasmic adaptor subunit [Flavobacteriales bacterium]|nr:efflux RND transporter periplasmic adaptor subunit [Flavobacteriales bacterium]
MLKNSTYSIMLFLAVSLVMSSCSNESEKAKGMPVLKIPVVEVIQQDVPVYSEFIGQTYGRQDIPIRARVDGFLEGMYFNEGERVKKDQLLYKIEPQSLTADLAASESKVVEAETNVINAKSELDRVEPLAEMNAVSKSELDNANARYKSALAQLESAKANKKITSISLSYSEVRSPIDGLIGITKAKVGEYVGKDPNPIILNSVSKIDTILVRFYITEEVYLKMARIYEKAIRDGAEGRKVRSEDKGQLFLILADGSTFDHTGIVDFIDNKIDANTGSLLAQASFPNPDKVLRPGLFAKIRTIMDVRKDAILVPQRAVQFVQGQTNVLVVDKDNKVEYRAVSTGVKYKNVWEIKEGLKPGDKIVLEGAHKLKTGMTIDPDVKEFKISGSDDNFVKKETKANSDSGNKVGTKSENANNIEFAIQIYSSRTKISTTDKLFKGIKGVSVYKEKNTFRYICNKDSDYAIVVPNENKLRSKGFNEAFIVAFKDGKRIDVNMARKILQ